MRRGVDAPRLWLLLGTGLAATLAAAKAHGRQVRLEREHAGHHEVVFGGSNPPFVEALWRRDRWRYWTAFPLLLAVAAGLLWLAHGWGAHLLAAPLWAAVGAFALAGLRSHASLLRALRERPAEAAWRRAALRGSATWWSLVGLLALAVAALSTP